MAPVVGILISLRRRLRRVFEVRPATGRNNNAKFNAFCWFPGLEEVKQIRGEWRKCLGVSVFVILHLLKSQEEEAKEGNVL